MVKKYLGLEHQNLFRVMRTTLPESQRFDVNMVGLIYALSGCDELNSLLSPVIDSKDGLDLQRALSIVQEVQDEGIRRLGMFVISLYADLDMSVLELSQIRNDQHFDLVVEIIQIKRRGSEGTEYSYGDGGTIRFSE